MSIRSEKVASTIKKAITQTISDIAREENAGLVTLTAVRMSPDLTIAKIYISVFAAQTSPLAFIKKLEKRKGEIRSLVGRSVRLRQTPDLRFYLDDTLDQIDHIQDLIDQVKKEDREEE